MRLGRGGGESMDGDTRSDNGVIMSGAESRGGVTESGSGDGGDGMAVEGGSHVRSILVIDRHILKHTVVHRITFLSFGH